MTYSEFKTRMTEDIKSYMTEKYPGCKVDHRTIEKVNREQVEMITIRIKDRKDGPAIDVKDCFEDMNQRDMSYDEMLEEVKKRLDLTMKAAPKIAADDFSGFKDKVILALINTEKNKNMLESVPHRAYHEFTIVYRYIAFEDNQKMTGAIVTNDMLNIFGCTEEELYKYAYENTKKDAVACSVFGLPILTTNRRIFGAASILFPELVKEVASYFGCDLYLVPSSTDEWTALSVRGILGGAAYVNNMLRDVNSQAESEELILGERCYYYDYKTGEIRLAQ